MIVTDFASSASPQYNYYLTRIADATAIFTDKVLLAYYVKFGKLLVIAEIETFDPAKWVNSLIDIRSGVIRPGTTTILDGRFGRFIAERARLFDDYRRQGTAAMSQRQREKLQTRFQQEIEQLAHSEMARALVADSEWEDSIPKVGRNEPCPCGSGAKYKRCHGR